MPIPLSERVTELISIIFIRVFFVCFFVFIDEATVVSRQRCFSALLFEPLMLQLYLKHNIYILGVFTEKPYSK